MLIVSTAAFQAMKKLNAFQTHKRCQVGKRCPLKGNPKTDVYNRTKKNMFADSATQRLVRALHTQPLKVQNFFTLAWFSI